MNSTLVPPVVLPFPRRADGHPNPTASLTPDSAQRVAPEENQERDTQLVFDDVSGLLSTNTRRNINRPARARRSASGAEMATGLISADPTRLEEVAWETG